MATGKASRVQLRPEGTGPKMLTFLLKNFPLFASDGTTQTTEDVEIQAVTILDQNGNVVGSSSSPTTTNAQTLTTRFDYAARVDGNPVYIGQAIPGSSDTDNASTAWTIKLFAYDNLNRCTSIKVVTGSAWSQRATYTYV